MSCLFCDIVAGKIPATILHQDEQVVAFSDINPQAPVHILVIPKRHIADLDSLQSDDGPLLAHLFQVVQQLAQEHKIQGAYRLVANCGAPAGQSVFHLHFHILGGRALSWPPG